MLARLTVVVLAIVACAGCKNCQYLGDHPIITSANGTKLCAAHHMPLVSQRGYRRDGNEIILYHFHGKSFIADYCNPNHIHPGLSLHRKRGYTTPYLVTYCPICEAAFQKHWNSLDREEPASKWEQWRAGVSLD